MDDGVRTRVTGLVVVAVLSLLMVALLARVLQLQVRPDPRLLDHVGDRLARVPEPAPRGDVLDRRGRVLAATRFGYRVFVDPTRFPVPPDMAIVALAQAVGEPVERVGERIVSRMARNQALRAAAPGEADPPGLVRYVTIGGVLDDAALEAVKQLKVSGVHLELSPVRESSSAASAASIVGMVGDDQTGLAGIERLIDRDAASRAVPGELRYVRDAAGRPLWIDPDGYVPPRRGGDVRLSIDAVLQGIAVEELRRGVEDAQAAGGRLVMMDPSTGEVLALVDLVRTVPDAVPYDWAAPIQQSNQRRFITIPADPLRQLHESLARNRCVQDVYEPGSTFKAFMWAATTELGLARPDEIVNTHSGKWSTPYGRPIEDVVRRPTMTWAEVLINSSNIGMASITRRMSDRQMRDAVVRFGFGQRTGIELPGESAGLVTSQRNWSKYTQTSVAMGHEIAVTPVQMVRAFSVFARPGDLAGTLPTVTLLARPPDDAGILQRVLPAGIARLARETMRGVTHKLDERMAREFSPPETGWQYELFGKSGTAEIPLGRPPPGKRRPRGSDGYYNNQHNASFIAGGPVVSPRLVVLVVIDDPGPALRARKRHYGAYVAGPVVRRVMERSLRYLGVAPSPPAPDTPAQAE